MSSEKEVRRRTRNSFIVGAVFLITGIFGWAALMTASEEDGIPWPLRRMLRFNESVWRGMFQVNRVGPIPAAPPRGKKVRVNGKLGIQTDINAERWRLRLLTPESEAKAIKRDLSMADFKLMPKVETTTEFKCIEGWSEVFSYAGVRFSEFMRQMGLSEKYKYVGLETVDGEYYVSIDMESMLHPQTLLAYEMNGHPLTPEHGAPLRLVVPVKYGIKSLKQVGTIRFSNERLPDYWAERGYDWYSGL